MSSGNTQTVLATVLSYIGRELRTGVGGFLDHAEQALYADASPRSGGRDQPSSYAAARWLSNNRAQLEEAMQQRLTDSFFGRAKKKNVAFDELQILDDDALDVVVVRARMVSQVMEAARSQVVALEARLRALRDAGADINVKALNPGVIADGFLAVLNELAVPRTVQMPLLEAYGVRGVERLVRFYEGINQLLIEHGVLPDFKNMVGVSSDPRVRKDPPESGTVVVVAGNAGVSEQVPMPAPGRAVAVGAASGQAEVVAQMAADAISSTPVAPPPLPSMPPPQGEVPTAPAGVAGDVVVPAQLLPYLLDAKITLMQQTLDRLTVDQWRPGILREQFALPPPFALTPREQESVDHLEAVFLDLLRDPRISARFRTEMSQLVLPLMMVRLKDADELTDPDNAVRRFVRQLALLGFRDLEYPVENFDSVRSVVGRIVSERAQDVSSFRSGADALNTIARKEAQRQIELRQQQRRDVTPPEAAQAAADDRHRLMREAHQHVLGELRLLSTGLQLPPPVQQYVVRMLGPWMMIRYQRYGVESEAMRDARSFAMVFFRLLTPATSRTDHDTKVVLRKHALEEIEVRAARSSRLDPELREAILVQIEKLFGELDDDPAAGVRKEFGEAGAECTAYLEGLEENYAD